MVKLLELNDIINTTVQRYNLIKKGDHSSAAALPLQSSISPNSSLTLSPGQQEVPLIDFDGDNATSSGSPPSTRPEDDLLGLAFGDSGSGSSNDIFGTGGGIALGFGANTSMFTPLNVIKCMLNHRNRYPRAPITLLHNASKHCRKTTNHPHPFPHSILPIIQTKLQRLLIPLQPPTYISNRRLHQPKQSEHPNPTLAAVPPPTPTPALLSAPTKRGGARRLGRLCIGVTAGIECTKVGVE